MTSKYFNSNIFFLINELGSQVELPHDFLEFIKCNSGDLSIYSLKPKELESIGLAIKREDQIYIFESEEMHQASSLSKPLSLNQLKAGELKILNGKIGESFGHKKCVLEQFDNIKNAPIGAFFHLIL